jgi:hypothetical protein
MDTIENLRLTLLISLLVLLVAVLWRRLKRKVVAKELPAPIHAELIALQVAYHPLRLRVEVSLPDRQDLGSTLVKADHSPLHEWSKMTLDPGMHTFELLLPVLADGPHYYQLSTATQRTVRVFRLQQ